MKVSKKQLKKIIKEEKAKLLEMPQGERFTHGIFNGNYLYDILVDDVEDYLRQISTTDPALGSGLTRAELDKMREALMFAFENIKEDYS